MSKEKYLRFKLNIQKCIEGIQLLSAHKPGITQYYIGKIFFFADREHLMDWGRPISGDRYVAMQHGPVPSVIYDLLKSTSGEPDAIVDELNKHVRTNPNGNKVEVFSLDEEPKCPNLSKTDKEYLLNALVKYGKMGFGDIERESHEDIAWKKAWEQIGLNNEMDLRMWFQHNPAMLNELFETTSAIH